ncbi:hypothetical protein IT396_01410 [Candidatus Nomurabacteria bacterium]|nr:hypothetical protein [Candidatus Nomurabacteria bacterium]
MKIGVLGCFYGAPDLLERTITPWLEVKAQGYDIVLAAASVQFKEYAELGYPDNDQTTREALRANSRHFDALFLDEQPMYEKEVRSLVLYALLAKGVDAIWILDGDEHYTAQQIKDIIAFVEKTPQFDYYHVHFDNHVFGVSSPGAFFPPRIIRTDRSGGIRNFKFDNEVAFNDGSSLYTRIPGIVPPSIAKVIHHTWRREDVGRKLAYQHKHFGHSSYTLDSSGALVFNAEYYKHHDMPVPQASAALPADAEKPSLHIVYAPPQGYPELLKSLLYSLLLLERHNAVRINATFIYEAENLHGSEVEQILSLCPVPYTIVAPEGDLLEQAVSLAHDADFLFFASGEYAYEASTLHELFYTYKLLSKELGPLLLCPADDATHYKKDRLVDSKLILGTRKHWRVCTPHKELLFIPQELLSIARKGYDELRSVPALCPIPTLAHNKKKDAEPFSDWRRAAQIKDEPKQS